MVVVGMSSMPLKVIGREAYYKLKFFLGYQRILDTKGAQHLKK
jgi:hypothetical protein